MSVRQNLIDICELIVDCEHKTAPTQETGYPSIRTPNIGRGRLILDGANRVSEETYRAWTRRAVPQAEDLILAREAPIGNVAIIPKNLKVCLGQRTVLIRPDKNKVVPMFLLYLMLGNGIQNRLLAHSTGATVAHLNMRDIRNLELPRLPPLTTQRKIAAILGNYDDLIENNTRRIKILEEMASAIYREWFVKFRFPGHEHVKIAESELGLIPQGWEIAKLSDVLENTKEHVKPGKRLEGFPYVPIDCIPRRSIALSVHKPYTEAKSSLIAFKRNDILFGAMRSYFHKVVLAPFDGITRQTCFVLRSRNCDDYAFNLFTVFQDSTITYSSNHSTGSTIPYTMWDGALAIMPIVKPPDRLIRIFGETVGPMLELIQVLSMRNTILRKNRDLLLPKLISGELDVSDLDIATDLHRSQEGEKPMQSAPAPIWMDRIAIDEKILTGKPVIKGTRLAVEFIIDLLAHGWSEAEILENYPGIVVEDIRACLAYADKTTVQ